MKKVLLILLPALVLSVAACVKDNSDSDNPKNVLLTGKWKATFIAQDANGNQMLDKSEETPVSSVYYHHLILVTRGGGVAIDSDFTVSAIPPYDDTVYAYPATWGLVGLDYLRLSISKSNGTADSTYITRVVSVDSSSLLLLDTVNGGNKWYGYSRY